MLYVKDNKSKPKIFKSTQENIFFMTDSIKVNEVFKTYDYSIFKVIDGNRNISIANVNRLVKSMQNEFLQVPIIVNEKYEVIDGQHRLRACEKTNNPIYYLIVSGYSLSQVHKLNAISKKWNFYDYLDAYANMEIKDYQIAKGFVEKYGFGSMETLAMLKGRSSSLEKQVFYEGKFKVTDILKAEKIADNITYVGVYYKGYKRRSFVAAMMYLLENDLFDIETFLAKLEKNQTKLVDCTTKEQYLQLIEEIYNYHNKYKVRFF